MLKDLANDLFSPSFGVGNMLPFDFEIGYILYSIPALLLPMFSLCPIFGRRRIPFAQSDWNEV